MLDLDVRAFFDSVPHDLLLKAVAHHTDERWVLLYIERWLKAPMQMPDGTLVAREKGTPQGSPISPVLGQHVHALCVRPVDGPGAPGLPIRALRGRHRCSIATPRNRPELRAAIADRLGAVGLELHPDKTKIVYCKDANRPGSSSTPASTSSATPSGAAWPVAGTATS